MTMQFKLVNVNANSGWINTGVTLDSGQRLTIFPLVRLDEQIPVTEYEQDVAGNQGGSGVNTGLDVTAGQLIRITATGIWNWSTAPGQTSDADGFSSPRPDQAGFVAPQLPPFALLARIGTTGLWTLIGSAGALLAPASGRLYLILNDHASYGYNDNSGEVSAKIRVQDFTCGLKGRVGGTSATAFPVVAPFDHIVAPFESLNDASLELALHNCPAGIVPALIIIDAPLAPENANACEVGSYYPSPVGGNPIRLDTATKIFSATDLIINAPGEALTFTRFYNQDHLDDTLDEMMGLGWSHNHAYSFSFTDVPTNHVIHIDLPNGSPLKFDYQDPTHFNARDGSTAQIYHDTINDEFVLTTESRTTFVFEDTSPYRLVRRAWPTGELWQYSYEGTTTKLLQVQIGSAASPDRYLHFSYFPNNHLDGYKREQLWRVGDHTSPDLNDPEGRYIEFDYIPERVSGADITFPKALLSNVTDVRGNSWTYSYFGQETGETTTAQLNFLVKRESPAVDVGNGSSSVLTLEALEYATNAHGNITQIIQHRGDNLLETEFSFPDNRSKIVGELRAGREIQHYFANGVFVGSADGKGNLAWQAVADNYRPEARGDANGHETALEWSADGARLEKIIDPIENETQFAYNSDGTLQKVIDAEGRTTLYLYDNVHRQPAIILVAEADTEIMPINGSMEVDSGWHEIGSVVFQEQSTFRVESGSFAWHVGAHQGGGIESDAWAAEEGHSYLITARVQDPNDGTDQMKMHVSTTNAADVYNQHYLQWETLRTIYTPQTNEQVRLQFTATTPLAEFVVDTISIIDLTNLLQWQEYRYDAKGQIIEEVRRNPQDGSVLQQTSRTYYASGTSVGLLEKLREYNSNDIMDFRDTTYTYDAVGRVVKTEHSSLFGTCQTSYTVYDAAGNVVASICNYHNLNNAPTNADQAADLYDPAFPDKNHVTTYEYDALGRRVKTTVNAGSAFQQTTLTLYDALGRVTRTIANYHNPLLSTNPDVYTYTPPATWQWDGETWKDAVNEVIGHDSTTEENVYNIITDMAYNQRGLLRLQQDTRGNVTLYGYDDADRLVKTVQNASDPDYDNDYSNSNADPDLSSYAENPKIDQDIITTNSYDPAGNLVKTVNALGSVNFTVYDALNRPIKTVRNAKSAATIALDPDDLNYNAANDPRSDAYSPSSAADEDIITTNSYDAAGKLVKTIDALGNVSFTVYDMLNRPIKTVRNAKPAATIALDLGDLNYNAANDPRSDAYSPSSAADEDIISATYYDDHGRMGYSEDMLQRRTWSAYDGFGRQVKSIVNAVGDDTDGGSGDPRSGSYFPSPDSDKDLITVTYYNDDGRVYRTDDIHGNSTLYGYDAQGRLVKTVRNASDLATPVAPNLSNYVPGSNPDQDIITATVYDALGRVWKSIDPAGLETRFVYDLLGRRIRTIANYAAQGASDPADWVWDAADNHWQQANGTAIDHGTDFDHNLISDTTYNQAGQVVATRDARGTLTAFTYDAAGRRLTVTQAADTPLATTSYTCYDKAGRVLRTIANYIPAYDENDQLISPDAWDENGNWLFEPDQNGPYADQNIITEFQYDRAGRRTHVIDPLGNVTLTTYFKDGQIKSIVDAEGTETQYRYDKLRRRTRVVQGFSANGEDPEEWAWDNTDTRWEKSDGTAITYGANSDQNILVDVTYDKGGRMLSLRDPRGNLTEYEYDLLDRRTSLTNPLNKTWETAYDNLIGGGTRTTLTDPNGVSTHRDTDRLGRLASIAYGDPTTTPDVRFSYNAAGVRTKMTEYGSASFTDPVRETRYTYDDQHRLVSVGFDTNADTTIDETVSYEYDAGGLRTKLTMPGTLEITYTYNAKGQLVSLSDWADQTTQFAYDNTGRHIATERANGLRSRYAYDAAGRLRSLRHTAPSRTLAHFAYEVDGRGNRTQALELLSHPATTTDTVIAYDADVVEYVGTWTEDAVNGFMETDGIAASLKLMFFGSDAELTIGTGSDHSLFDIYIGKTLWRSIDGYAPTPGTRIIPIELDGEGPHLLELRNRPQHNLQSSGYTLRFKQLLVPDISYDLHTIDYTYDALSRLLTADYRAGSSSTATPFNQYTYAYDVAGNLVNMDGVTRTYNAANQLTDDGTNTLNYDHSGNLTDDGPNTYTWDRANRLLSMGGVSSAYDGLGNRIRQTVGSDITRYLLDVQPGLAVVLSATTNTDITRYVHGPRGIHAQQNSNDDWRWLMQDGLGSVRGVVDDTLAVQESRSYTPYGEPSSTSGSNQTVYGFTGEPTDANDLLYLRARYLNPAFGVFASLDPFAGILDRAMSLNGYGWVEGNTPNLIDPSGLNNCFSNRFEGAEYCEIGGGGSGGRATSGSTSSPAWQRGASTADPTGAWGGASGPNPRTVPTGAAIDYPVINTGLQIPARPAVSPITSPGLYPPIGQARIPLTMGSAMDIAMACNRAICSRVDFDMLFENLGIASTSVSPSINPATNPSPTSEGTAQQERRQRRKGVALGLTFLGPVPILEIFADALSNDQLLVSHWERWYLDDISKYTREEIRAMNARRFRSVVEPIITRYAERRLLYVNLQGISQVYGYGIGEIDQLIDDYGSAYEGAERFPFAMELEILSDSDFCDRAQFFDGAQTQLSVGSVGICT